MLISASISQFRNNIALYLERVVNGVSVVIRDEKKGYTIAKILPMSTFDSALYGQILQKYAGSISREAHPEWSNEQTIQDWLHKTRLSDERNF